MALSKITAEQLYENGVVSAPDTLIGSPTENKKVFDKMITQLVAPAYNACVDVVNELVREEQEVASSEAARAAAETERQDAEMERRSEEEARVESENERAANETERVEAEKLRKMNEADRVSAEIDRGSMEKDRMDAEQSRLEAEEERENAEHDRTIAEEKRAAAETARNMWENYSASKSYVPGNKVSYGGSSYLNTKACSGVMPTNGSYWLLIAAKGDTGPQGTQGNQGGVFIPIIDEDGTLSWTSDGGVDADAPDPVNIKGPPGNGDMNKNDYDPEGEISEMGGIPKFFFKNIEEELEDIDPEGVVREVGGVAAYVEQELEGFEGGVSLEELDKKLDKTGGVIADDDYETTLSPDGVVVSDGNFGTEVRGTGVRIEEDSEDAKSASFGVDELAFFHEYEEEPEYGAGDGDVISLTETARMTPGGIEIETREGKITLSIRGGLCFEDTKGNVNRLGGVDYIEEDDPNNAVMYGDMERYVEDAIPNIETDDTLHYEGGKLSVNTADAVGDNTLPITAAAVNATVGNIEILLSQI